ncbi:MAG TPA: acetyl-CoA hydrolase/transferase C-terminal domain-containing protein [Vicinamibacteria bacterium]|nr:acetyl-CoA hydrolase/transferase C-terminal domain-containing protein [Vicinamibacteria bacterium]
MIRRGPAASRWAEDYSRKLTTAAEAIRAIRSGDRVWIQPGCSNPEPLVQAMVARADELRDVEIVHLLTMGVAPYAEPRYSASFRHRSLFTGGNVREAVNDGRADFVPVHLSDIPRLIASGQQPVDVALVHLSPPDEHGFCSFGVGVECTKAAAEAARDVVALVNAQMPRSLGDCFIHVSRLGHVVEVDRPVLELEAPAAVSAVSRAIGVRVAELIENGATLQMGIGEVPDAILHELKDRRDLGIHTEMFSDGVVELFEAGVINGEAKTLHRGKIVASFVLGSKRCFDFLHNNPFVEFHPSDYVNDPFIIARNERMVAINAALAVDITGQVCADSLGRSIYSGFGGQADFIRGAARARRGKPVIVLPSTAKGGSLSRIVDVLPEGSGVVTTRADVHYVATEHGVAHLYGKSLRERARALIGVAHPDFREELTWAARRRRVL